MIFDVSNIKLRGARLLVDKPKPVWNTQERKVGSGVLFAPQRSIHNSLGYATMSTVMAVGPGVIEDIKPGDRLLLDEFCGRPIWNGDRDLPYWIVGESEIMAVLEGPFADDAEAADVT